MVYNIQMYYVVALGNPGKEYELTRHNVGFLALDYLVAALALPEPIKNNTYNGRFSRGKIGGSEVSLLYPETFMNHSGAAVKKLVEKDEAGALMVIYDDVSLPFGEMKISFGRGDGGHNGLRSVIDSLGTKDFIRLRIGIAPKSFWTGKTKILTGEELPRFVLSKFSKSELSQLREDVLVKVEQAISLTLKEGYVKAMNKFN